MKSYPDPAVMMTLSAIAYYTDIPGQLADTHYATDGIWSLTWGPVQDELGNLAYVVVNASTNAYALVIRGSETNFSFATLDNWFFDLDVLIQEDWPYFPDTPGARISNGAYLQASNLTSASSSGVTLATFLTEQVPSSATLYLTGHSLGGNLASVLAPWISTLRGPAHGQPDPNTHVYTFAACSAGNTTFATAFDKRFPNSWRYWNSLDIVPKVWDNLLAINSIYDCLSMPTPFDIQMLVDGMETDLWASETAYDSYYDQPNGDGTRLEGIASIGVPWLAEVVIQHVWNSYLKLLNAPPIEASLFVGPSPTFAILMA